MTQRYSEIQIQNGCNVDRWQRGLMAWLSVYLRHGLLMTYHEGWHRFIEQAVEDRYYEHTLVRLHRTGVSLTCSSSGSLHGLMRQKAYLANNRRLQRGVWENLVVGPLSRWLTTSYGPIQAGAEPAQLYLGQIPKRELDACARTFQAVE